MMLRVCIIVALVFAVNAGFLHKNENDIDNAGDANVLFADESEELGGSFDKNGEADDADEAQDDEGAEEEEHEEEGTAAVKDATTEDSSDKIADEAADEDFMSGLTSQQKRNTSTYDIANEAVDTDFTRGLTSRQSSDVEGKTIVQTVVTAGVASAKACSACMKSLWTKEVPAIRNCMQHESMYFKDQKDAARDVKKKCGAEARARVRAAATQCKSQCPTKKETMESLLTMRSELVTDEQLEEAAIFAEIEASDAADHSTAKSGKAALLQASTDSMASTQARRLMELVQKTNKLASEDHRISKETVVARQMANNVLGDTKVGAEVSALLTQAVSEANRAAAGERRLAAIEAHQVQKLESMGGTPAH